MEDDPSGNPLGLFSRSHAPEPGRQSSLSPRPERLVHDTHVLSPVMYRFVPRYGEVNLGCQLQSDVAERSMDKVISIGGVRVVNESYEELRLKQAGKA